MDGLSKNYSRSDQIIADGLQNIHRVHIEEDNNDAPVSCLSSRPINHTLTINTTLTDDGSYQQQLEKQHDNDNEWSCSYDTEDDDRTQEYNKNALYHSDNITINNHQIINSPTKEMKDDVKNKSFYLEWLHNSNFFLVCNLSIYSMLGFMLRYFIGELFYSGCDDNEQEGMHLLCVTSTMSPIFIDLPANMLGCFLMGLMSTSTKLKSTNNMNNASSLSQLLPIVHENNYFQNWNNMHLSIRTGLCGCLTTFASWNTQMVTMIGSKNISLIIQALFGYVIGMHCGYMSLKFGQHVSMCIYHYFHCVDQQQQVNIIHLQEEIDPQNNDKKQKEKDSKNNNRIIEIFHLLAPYMVVISILTYFTITNNRSLWLSSLAAPIGAIIRWRLSVSFNKQSNNTWIPYHGTFTANIVGSILSIIATSFLIVSSSSPTGATDVTQDILLAIKSGLAGSLSTVSTFIDEYDNLLSKHNKNNFMNAYKYVYGTIMTACIMSIFVYVPMSYA